MNDEIRPIAGQGFAPPAGPYSHAVAFDRLLFVSGQAGLDPATGRIVGADVASQTERTLRNIETILRAAGSDLSHVLRCGVYLTDMGDFREMNAVYARVFGDHRPARTTIQAVAFPSPGARVEIDAIAVLPG